MPCTHKTGCPFFTKRLAVHETMYKTHVDKLCNGASDGCAIFQVIKVIGVTKVPGNLFPNQTFRVRQILQDLGAT
jgi:hypothetical protein